ncbi:MAG: nuclear transport factor 2 family protein [Bacteroidales bacterium]|nr:nuclear transport factor 2 family protein [Bacteroidales bacterium]
MKRLILITALICISLLTFSQNEKEKNAIIDLINDSYVEGIQNRKNVENIEKGFHPGFNLLGIDNQDNLTMYPIYTWSANISRAVESGQMPDLETTARYPMIDITGNAAVAKVELYKGGKQIFTDYLSLYKFADGWKIVSKIYYRIPQE